MHLEAMMQSMELKEETLDVTHATYILDQAGHNKRPPSHFHALSHLSSRHN